MIRHSEILVPDFDPLAADLALVDAVQRRDSEAREIAMLEDPALGPIMEFALLTEVDA